MKIKYLLCILILSSIISACEKIEIGKPVFCTVGTSYRVKAGLSFKIDSIDDYRCPVGLNCIWSGDVDLYFDINYHSEHIDTVLNLLTGSGFLKRLQVIHGK